MRERPGQVRETETATPGRPAVPSAWACHPAMPQLPLSGAHPAAHPSPQFLLEVPVQKSSRGSFQACFPPLPAKGQENQGQLPIRGQRGEVALSLAFQKRFLLPALSQGCTE